MNLPKFQMPTQFGKWSQIAVMLATAAGLFANAQDLKSDMTDLKGSVEAMRAQIAVLNERTAYIQRDMEREKIRLDQMQESGRVWRGSAIPN